jgi:hypothetical protein
MALITLFFSDYYHDFVCATYIVIPTVQIYCFYVITFTLSINKTLLQV